MTEPSANHNQFAYSITEISTALKRVVEDNFGHVRLRGEISGWKLAASGHAYLKLKDTGAVLDAVCWKGVTGKMAFRPEDGMEVIATGRITTYPGRSNYQIVIDYMEPAGVGALMALLEKRKAALAAEGLFDAARKKRLPFMPRVIGVVTSPTGAVIRDIIHRLSDRFPCHVLVWPVLVQGEDAARQVAAAIDGFNALPETNERTPVSFFHVGIASSAIPRPDLIIVARGGGSLEDLWPFNEELVVRAAAASQIPLISAVGHETDTTLIDYAADLRAPTPTAAAEIAVPVREEWVFTLLEHGNRLTLAANRLLLSRRERLDGMARGLTHPGRLLDLGVQKLDDWSERLEGAMAQRLAKAAQWVDGLTHGLPHPRQLIERAEMNLRERGERLRAGYPLFFSRKQQSLALLQSGLRPGGVRQAVEHYERTLASLAERMQRLMQRVLTDNYATTERYGRLLTTLGPEQILRRGFVLVRGKTGGLITSAASLPSRERITLEFADGSASAMTD